MPSYLIRDHSQRVFAAVESAFNGGFAATGPAAGDAMRFVSGSFEDMAREYLPNDEMTGTRLTKSGERGQYPVLPGRLLVPLIGSGTIDVPPDFRPMLLAATFIETVNAGVSVVYDRDPTGETGGEVSAAIASVNKDGSAADYYGGVRVAPDIKVPGFGTMLARIEFGLQAAVASHMVRTRVGTGGITNVATTLPLDPKHGWIHGGIDFFISVTDGTNTEVMKVTAVGESSCTVVRNVLGAGAFAFVATDTIKAYLPGSYSTSSVAQISDRHGSLTLDDGSGAADFDFFKGDLVMQTGAGIGDKLAFEDHRTYAVAEKLSEEGCVATIDHPCRAGSTGEAWLTRCCDEGTDLAAVLQIGTSEGNRITFTMNDCRVNSFKAPRAGEGARKATTVLRAYGDNGADVSIKFH